MKKYIAFFLVVLVFVSFVPLNAFADDEDVKITCIVDKCGDSSTTYIQAIKSNDELYIDASSIPDIARYTYKQNSEKIVYTLGNKYIAIDPSNGSLLVNNSRQNFSDIISKDGKYYIPMSEILPWLNVTCEVDNGKLYILSDECSFWEISKDFSFTDYAFNISDFSEGDSYDVLSFALLNTFDSILNWDSAWKKYYKVKDYRNTSAPNTVYSYEIFRDCMREMAIPDSGKSGLVTKAISKISKGTSTVGKLSGYGLKANDLLAESVGAGKYTDDKFQYWLLDNFGVFEDSGKALEKSVKYDNVIDSMKVAKVAGKAIKHIKTGLTYLRIMKHDTENYANAIDWIYLSDGSSANSVDVLAAREVLDIMKDNAYNVGDMTIDITLDLLYDIFIHEITDDSKELASKILSMFDQYTSAIDLALTVFWPINEATSEVSKLGEYQQMQFTAISGYNRAYSTISEVSELGISNANESAIIALRSAKKCFSAMGDLFDCFKEDGSMDYFVDRVDDKILDFQRCSIYASHDAICDKAEETDLYSEMEQELDLQEVAKISKSDLTASCWELRGYRHSDSEFIRFYDDGRFLATGGFDIKSILGTGHYTYEDGTIEMSYDGLDLNDTLNYSIADDCFISQTRERIDSDREDENGNRASAPRELVSLDKNLADLYFPIVSYSTDSFSITMPVYADYHNSGSLSVTENDDGIEFYYSLSSSPEGKIPICGVYLTEDYAPNELSYDFGEEVLAQKGSKTVFVMHPQGEAIANSCGLDGNDSNWYVMLRDFLYCAFEFADIKIY